MSSAACVKVAIKGKGGDQSTVNGSVHDEEYRAENNALGTPQEEVWKGGMLLSHYLTKGAR